jgi:hypothetical protein
MDVIMYIVVLRDKIHINNFDKELFVYDDFYNLVHDDKNHDHTKDNLEQKQHIHEKFISLKHTTNF